MRAVRTLTLRDGSTRWPMLGLGTWRLGESARQRRAEVAAVHLALTLGYRLIDTAEMYGDGGAEEVVGEAIGQALREGLCRREDLVVVSKVLPHHASRAGTEAACEASLRRLGLDHLDLYLLHWPGPHPLRQTVEAFERLQARGLIGRWGVSNFDLDAMFRLQALPGGAACAANQVCYSLRQRGIDFDLAPWQRRQGLPLMAYCPIDQSALARHAGLAGLAAERGWTAAQLALAWTLRDGATIAIPKAVRETHLRENLAAADLVLDAGLRDALDRLFPPPPRAQPLAVV
jgi:diketogulonate reductase-like aldo/keto reductase